MTHPDPLLHEILQGLASTPKVLPPALFYDERGSVLFEEITRLPEYYLTRAESFILETCGAEIAEAIAPRDTRVVFIEPGVGSSTKAASILRHLPDAAYVGLDVSPTALERGAVALRRLLPHIAVTSIVGNFLADAAPYSLPEGHRVAFFPGSTLGNFEPAGAGAFLRRLARLVGPGGHVLVGLDRWKDPAVLHAAYCDAQGVTAAFNRNALAHLARRFDADIDPQSFEHVVVVDPVAQRVEMHLRAMRALSFVLAGQVVRFEAGEQVRTEHCYKFDGARVAELAQIAGLVLRRRWTDSGQRFDQFLFEA